MLSLILSLACGQVGAAVSERPNLVVFLVDDLGWQDTGLQLGATPSPWQEHWRTPNVERMAREGMSFTDAYASAAVCSPSRIALQTGRAPARHGSTYWILHAGRDTSAQHPRLSPPEWDLDGLQPGETTLAGLLSDAGYRSIHVGKAHLGGKGSPGDDPLALGFDVNVAGHGAGAPGSYLGTEAFGWTKTPDSVWNVPGLDEYHGQEVWLTDVLAERAVEELTAAHEAGEPFFLHFAPYAVHTPIMPDPARVAAYGELPPIEAAYATLIEGVDAALGRVLETLDDLGIAEETLVVFASDNGGLAAHTRAGDKHRQNAPLSSGKGSAYEGGVRIPMFARWPGNVPGGRRSSEPVVLHDLFPTLTALAGVDVDPEYRATLDGVDLRAVLSGDADTLEERAIVWHQPHFWGVNGPGIEPYSAIRRGPLKLIWFHDGDRLELYDVVADPGETRDLAGKSPSEVAELAKELGTYLRGVGALGSIVSATGAPVAWPDE
jgi:arylsulfatase A-like enzyme